MATRSLHTSTSSMSTTSTSLEPIHRTVHLAAEDAQPNLLMRNVAQQWQRDGWKYYDLHGEVHYPLTIGANIAGRVDLTLQKRNGKGLWLESGDSAGRAALDQVQGSGLEDFWRSVWLNTGVAGEGVLLVTNDMGQYNIEVTSNEEVYQQADGKWVRADQMGHRQILDITATRITRFWRRHPRFGSQADSGLRSVLNECRELELLKLALLAKITSRLASVGILFLPNSISMPSPKASDGTLSGDPLVQQLMGMFQATIANPGSAAAAMPVLLRGPDEAGEKIRHIILDTALDEVEDKHRQELRMAIAQGIELPPETQTSAGKVNHWNAWHINESALNDHVLPVCRAGANLLTTRVLWPWLRAKGLNEADARAYRFAPDASRASTPLNKADLARQLYDRGAINEAALRDAHGYDETAAPTDEEIVRWLGVKLNNPAMAVWKLSENVPPEVLSGPTPPGMGGFGADEPQTDSGMLPGSPSTGLDQS